MNHAGEDGPVGWLSWFTPTQVPLLSCAYAKLTLLIFLHPCRHGDRRRRRVSPERLPVSKRPEDPDPHGRLELSGVGPPPVCSGV